MERHQDNFEGKLSGLLILLSNLIPYNGYENNMISILINDFYPPLFQIISLNDNKYRVKQVTKKGLQDFT